MDEKKFRQVWSSSDSVKQVCTLLGITDQSAYYWARKFHLPRFSDPNEENSPTPEEIAERAAEVRSTWSEEETERRAVGCARRRRYEVPSYVTNRESGLKRPTFTARA